MDYNFLWRINIYSGMVIRSFLPMYRFKNISNSFSQHSVAGEIMSKVEQLFKTVDFSGETDFKDRLRKHLFESREKAISDQDSRVGNEDGSSRKSSARPLSLDELELVNAAGDLAMQQHNPAGRAKSKFLQKGQENNSWTNTFSGKITDHETGE